MLPGKYVHNAEGKYLLGIDWRGWKSVNARPVLYEAAFVHGNHSHDCALIEDLVIGHATS